MDSEASAIRGIRIGKIGEVLAAVGIRRGDTVVMHSSLMHLGRPLDCPLSDYPMAVVDAVLAYLGEEGTLAVPAPNWDYGSKGIPFDIRTSSVERSIGVVSACVAARADAERSANPIFSVAAIGRHAREICRPDNASAFGPDSAWDRLFARGARMLLLGSGIDKVTFVRYIECRIGVPYLYHKLFKTPVTDNGKDLGLTVTAPVRYRHCPANYGLAKFGRRLRDAGVLKEVPFGDGIVTSIATEDCFSLGVAALQEDIHFFLEEPPRYVANEIPIA